MDESILIAALVQSDIICFVLLLIMLVKSVKTRRGTKGYAYLFIMLAATMVFVIANSLCNFIAWEYLAVPDIANYIINFFYFLSSGIQCYCWFLYSETIQASKLVSTWKRRLLCAVPLFIMMIMTIITPFTHWFYYIDQKGAYQRGPLMVIVVFIGMYHYFLCTSSKALFASTKKKNYAQKDTFQNLAMFAVGPLIAIILQYFCSGISFPTIGFTVGLLLVYMRTDELQISLDPLTGINNRTHLVRQISFKMKNHSPDGLLVLLMMDVDRFKMINDTYGHPEGDKALIRVANALKTAAGRGNFLARYGGDEFIVIMETATLRGIKTLCDAIQTEVKKRNMEEHASYPLTLSIGYAIYDPGVQSIPDFIKRADEALYIEKRKDRNDKK